MAFSHDLLLAFFLGGSGQSIGNTQHGLLIAKGVLVVRNI